MPTNRTRIRRGLIGGRLTFGQRAELLTGLKKFIYAADPGFASAAEMRAAWEHHRSKLRADRDFSVNDPGSRPWGFWRFDAGLKVRPGYGWRWPRGCRDERETVYRHYADEAERAEIEAH